MGRPQLAVIQGDKSLNITMTDAAKGDTAPPAEVSVTELTLRFLILNYGLDKVRRVYRMG